eukprot:CAMPEP_0170545806 /NCGR_PEP_ID=MMETSP0211-20121228/4177_1 /TAXON_ID=311385 /ORGANISM="Pseudokeronopsis sp., Strain OXSARD2" /LENGTH=33 /DNA_ID= /DNA_START= /DNA_END= /DNA_ORIENTATION=
MQPILMQLADDIMEMPVPMSPKDGTKKNMLLDL